MNAHQLSESFAGVVAVQPPTPDTEDLPNTNSSKPKVKEEKSPVINVHLQNQFNLLSVSNNTGRDRASDSDWKSTSDTSMYSSSRSPTPQVDVPPEVLEACDGLDDASLSSNSPPPDTGRGRARGRGRGRGRGRRPSTGTSTPNVVGKPAGGSKKIKEEPRSSSSQSEHTSESEQSSPSSASLDTASSSECTSCCSHSSCSCSESSSPSCDTSCDTSCSCPCHSEDESTSFESTDDLTDLPRAKRGSQLGKTGGKKVADSCTQC